MAKSKKSLGLNAANSAVNTIKVSTPNPKDLEIQSLVQDQKALNASSLKQAKKAAANPEADKNAVQQDQDASHHDDSLTSQAFISEDKIVAEINSLNGNTNSDFTTQVADSSRSISSALLVGGALLGGAAIAVAASGGDNNNNDDCPTLNIEAQDDKVTIDVGSDIGTLNLIVERTYANASIDSYNYLVSESETLEICDAINIEVYAYGTTAHIHDYCSDVDANNIENIIFDDVSINLTAANLSADAHLIFENSDGEMSGSLTTITLNATSQDSSVRFDISKDGNLDLNGDITINALQQCRNRFTLFSREAS
jgi:hypothetical protein